MVHTDTWHYLPHQCITTPSFFPHPRLHPYLYLRRDTPPPDCPYPPMAALPNSRATKPFSTVTCPPLRPHHHRDIGTTVNRRRTLLIWDRRRPLFLGHHSTFLLRHRHLEAAMHLSRETACTANVPRRIRLYTVTIPKDNCRACINSSSSLTIPQYATLLVNSIIPTCLNPNPKQMTCSLHSWIPATTMRIIQHTIDRYRHRPNLRILRLWIGRLMALRLRRRPKKGAIRSQQQGNHQTIRPGLTSSPKVHLTRAILYTCLSPLLNVTIRT